MIHKRITNDPYSRAKYTEAFTIWDRGFDSNEIDQIVEMCESNGLDEARILSKVTHGNETRISKVAFHRPTAENFWIFAKVNDLIERVNEEYYGFNLNGYDSFQYTVYDSAEKGHYDWHADSAFGSKMIPADMIQPRKLSVSVLLNDDYEGGEFEINDAGDQNNPSIIEPRKGRAIVFPSFIPHRVRPVIKGIRRSLVVWVVGPKFI